jgi:hypothetical protein
MSMYMLQELYVNCDQYMYVIIQITEHNTKSGWFSLVWSYDISN